MTFDMRSGNLHWNNILTGVSSLRRPAREVQQKIQTNCQLFFPLWRLGTSHPSYTLDSNERRSTQKRRQPCFYWARAGKIHSFFLIVCEVFVWRDRNRERRQMSLSESEQELICQTLWTDCSYSSFFRDARWKHDWRALKYRRGHLVRGRTYTC